MLVLMLFLLFSRFFFFRFCHAKRASFEAYDIEAIDEPNLSDNPMASLFVGVVTENFQFERIHGIYEGYGRDFIKRITRSHFITVMRQNIADNPFKFVRSEQHFIKCPDTSPDFENCDRLNKRITLMEYCLERPNCHWVASIIDDTYVSYEKVEKLIREIERNINPVKEAYAIGHCIGHKNLSFLQGGSGYLISRKAAELIVRHYLLVVSQFGLGDDIQMSQLLQGIGITLVESESDRFMGHEIQEDIWKRLVKGLPLDSCPKELPLSYCDTVLTSPRDYAFLHSCTFPNGTCKKKEILDSLPGDIYLYLNEYGIAVLCTKQKD